VIPTESHPLASQLSGVFYGNPAFEQLFEENEINLREWLDQIRSVLKYVALFLWEIVIECVL